MKKEKKKGRKKAGWIILAVIVALLAVFFIGGSAGKEEVHNLTIESVDLSALEDGEYVGSYAHSRWQDTVRVTVEDHKIVKIERIAPSDTTKQSLVDQLSAEVIEKQDVTVDTVAGASVSSNAFLKAVENALKGE